MLGRKIGGSLRARSILEERLKPLGYTVTWKEFPGRPQLLEAVKVGEVDFAHSGEAPPIFAQAAGAPLLYIGFAPDGPGGTARPAQPLGLAPRPQG